ncbi:uncharacterized protein LOC129951249 [Eupeodes corollae]|uniref:uncharacterized protein LOC129951249 n=1 Tax=Eupeodes corollae TaxID=290404 RepID=UPI002490B264|nr:uncharacterized protein LOC129951249 [Eupeodes corollae]
MARKWDRKMILSSILLVLIFIRHNVLASYASDFKPKWNGINQNQQPFHLQQTHTTHQSVQFAHRQHRHHHDASNIHKNNREMHIKPKHNETNDGTMVQVKNVSANNNRSRVNVNLNNYDAPTSAIKLEHNARSFWSHNNRQSNQENHQQHKERSLQAQNSQGKFQEKPPRNDYVYTGKISHEDLGPKTRYGSNNDYDNSRQHHHQESQQNKERSSLARNNQRKVLEKTSTSRIDYVDPGKVSHDDQGFKSKDEYDEDYDEDDYYGEVDDNENTIEVRRDETETEGEIPDYMLDESDSRKEEVKSADGAAHFVIAAETGRRQDVDYNSQEEYLNDESNPFNEEQNQNMSFTDRKWKYLGTPDAVREQFLQNKVSENAKRLREEGKCRWPHPKVIHVIEASDRFVPHCTILHRCADDTGCCNDDRKTCVAKSTALVDLYFYITPFGNKSKTSIGFRTFENHTECHCVERNRYRRTPRQNSLIISSNTAASNENCRCPAHFRVVRERSQCRCDCLSWSQKCYDLKEGNDRFPYKDQKCISENKCQKPFCEYGHYNKNNGRCPKLSRPTSRKNTRYSSDAESKVFNGPS